MGYLIYMLYGIGVCLCIMIGAVAVAFMIDIKLRRRAARYARNISTLKRLTDLRRPRSNGDIISRTILTEDELKFFSVLQTALPNCLIFPEVSFQALMKVSPSVKWSDRKAIFNTFAMKRADFVVCLPDTLEIVAVIELDDTTHKPAKDAARDALLSQAGIRVERFWKDANPEPKDILARFPGYISG